MGKKGKIFLTTVFFSLVLIVWFNGCGQKVVPDEPEIEIYSSISGIVSDSITGSIIPLVNVAMGTQKFLTDTTGRYIVNNLKRGGYTVNYTLTGYESQTKEYSLAQNSQTQGNVELNKLPIVDNSLLNPGGESAKNNIKVSSIGQTSVVITFQTYSTLTTTMVTNALIRYGQDSTSLNQTTATSQNSISHTITISGLEADKTYYYKVEATSPSDATITSTSVISTFKTDDGIAPSLTSLQERIYTDSAEIRWLSSEPATGKVYYGISEAAVTAKTSSVGTDTTNLDELTTDHTITLSGLKPKTKYYYQVESKDSSENFIAQNIKSFTTKELYAPILDKPVNITKTTVFLTWNLNSDPNLDNLHFDHYVMTTHTQDPTNNTSATVYATKTITEKETTKITIENLAEGTQYFFQLSVVDKGGNISLSGAVTGVTASTGEAYFDSFTTNSPINRDILGAYVRKATIADGSDAKGWIVGKKGQSARLTNSGGSSASVTWSVVSTPTTWDLLAVDGSSSQAAACGKVGTLLYTSNSNTTWNAVAAGTGVDLNDIHRDTNDTYWFCGPTTLGAFTPSGIPTAYIFDQSASPTPVIASGSWNGICAIDGSLMIVGDNGLIASASITGVMPAAFSNATNSLALLNGTNALSLQASQTQNLRAVDMVNTGTGWIVGDNGVILHRVTGGTGQWFADPIEFDIKENILSVEAIDSTLAYAVTDKGKILKYDNGSSKWIIINSFAGEELKTVAFGPDLGDNFGIAAGSSIYTVFQAH